MYNQSILNKIGRYLAGHQQTLAVAESVTAGQLQAALSLADNSAAFFQGGITAYNIQQKYRHLHVDPLHAINCNCISEQVAIEMAVAVSKSFLSDWGIGITGYASAMPEVGVNDLFACYAIVYRGEIKKTGTVTADKKTIPEVQQFYVTHILTTMEHCCRVSVEAESF